MKCSAIRHKLTVCATVREIYNQKWYKYSINSVDAIVLRSALDVAIELGNDANDKLVLVASDQRLLKAACNEGLLVFNPETDPEQVMRVWVES